MGNPDSRSRQEWIDDPTIDWAEMKVPEEEVDWDEVAEWDEANRLQEILEKYGGRILKTALNPDNPEASILINILAALSKEDQKIIVDFVGDPSNDLARLRAADVIQRARSQG